MRRDAWVTFIGRAGAAGLLPADAAAPTPAPVRPWPVTVLTGLGAWLAVLPLLGACLILLSFVFRDTEMYVIAAVALPGAVLALRQRDLSVFKEQLLFPLLLVGLAAAAMSLFHDRSMVAAAASLALVFLGTAWATPQPWLRQLLGAGAAWLLAQACGDRAPFGQWGGCHLALALWLFGHVVLRRRLNDGRTAPAAAVLEAILSGWGLATLFGLAMSSGRTFLLGEAVGSALIDGLTHEAWLGGSVAWAEALKGGASAALALAACAWGARAWPGLRAQWRTLVVPAVVLTVLAWRMPALGAALFALAFCVCGGRLLTATAAATAAAWIIGAFYYQMDLPLAQKGLLLAGAGAVLGAAAWWGWRAPAASATAPPGVAPAPVAPQAAGLRRAGIALCGLLVLAVVNVGIWQKEAVIGRGQTVYVAMAPVDPRSMMQGDYMRVNFAGMRALPDVPRVVRPGAPPQVVLRRDARGVATVLRLHGGEALRDDELLVNLTLGAHGWMLVSDAWFFQEGEAGRWSVARYGEFRVAPDGRAALVGLRGPDLGKL